MVKDFQDLELELNAQRTIIKEGIEVIKAMNHFLEFYGKNDAVSKVEIASAVLRMKQLAETTTLAQIVKLEKINELD